MALTNLQNLANLAKTAKQTGEGAQQVLKLAVDEVRPKPDQVRKQFSGIEELAESLKAEGQIQPIIVSSRGDDGKYEIQKGERRWRACQTAELTTIDAIVNSEEQSELDATAGELIENIQRDDLTPLEVAEALQLFVNDGWKKKDIAKRVGKPPSFVSAHLSLLKLPDCVKALYDKGITRDPETLNNLRQLYDLNAEHCTQMCDGALSEGMSRVESRRALNAEKKGEVPAKPAVEKVPEDATATPSGTSPKTAAAKPTQKVKVREDREDGLEWRKAKPSQLHIRLSVEIDGEWVSGHLLTNRVDDDSSYAWVALENDDTVRVPVTLIQLEKVTTR